MPRFVEQELRAFLRCGVLAHGFLRLHCDNCGCDRLVPFSCKRRGFCPSCCGRRMADTAAYLVDRVLPGVPIRQWVLTLPYALRYRCAYDTALTNKVLRAFVRALFAELRRRGRHHWGVRAQQCGAVAFIQRFGSALNLNLHFHTLALARDEPLLAVLATASLRGRSTSGPNAGERWRRLGDRVEPVDGGSDPVVSPRVRQHGGMSLHAAVAVPASDRRRLERLCCYIARPPLAQERLEDLPDGRLALRLKTRWRDGTSHIVMERNELIERLVPLIPPPRSHQLRYHGILAPCATWRDRVVPAGDSVIVGPEPEAEPPGPVECSSSTDPRGDQAGVGEGATAVEISGACADPRIPAPTGAESWAPSGADRCDRAPRRIPYRRYRWAELLQRVFEVDALRCPRCGSTLRLIAAIEDPAIARKILECMKLPARSPPLDEASGIALPPEPAAPDREAGWEFDQSPVHQEPEFH